jgi:hypothetical protein
MEWQGYGAPGAAHDRASVGRGFGAGGGMPPPQAGPYGAGTYPGGGAMMSQGPRKNTPGTISLVIGIMAVLMAIAGLVAMHSVISGSEFLKETVRNEGRITQEKMREIAKDIGSDKAAKMAGGALALLAVTCVFHLLALVGLVLGIVGLCLKGRPRGAALAGLLLSIAAGALFYLTGNAVVMAAAGG